MKDNRLYLINIKECIEQIETYLCYIQLLNA